jgi:hypothetical protein
MNKFNTLDIFRTKEDLSRSKESYANTPEKFSFTFGKKKFDVKIELDLNGWKTVFSKEVEYIKNDKALKTFIEKPLIYESVQKYFGSSSYQKEYVADAIKRGIIKKYDKNKIEEYITWTTLFAVYHDDGNYYGLGGETIFDEEHGIGINLSQCSDNHVGQFSDAFDHLKK